MADPQAIEGSTANISGETSESTLQLNVKTLDSRMYSFDVDKNIRVATFKEKIASPCGVPVGQQRLIFRGKVLKDDHWLSDYNVENGDTLHLVERQQPPASGSNTVEATSSNVNQGLGLNTGGSANRIGPIAHSVLLGTLNVGDPGEAVVPDVSRVIGAVLNSIGIGSNAVLMQPGGQSSQGNHVDGVQVYPGSQSQDGNQSAPWPMFPGQSIPHPMQVPLGAGLAVPTLNVPIPDSLNTLLEFISQMQAAFSQTGDQPDQSTAATGNVASGNSASGNATAGNFPTNLRSLARVEALSLVLQHAQRLLSDHAVPALSHTAGRLNQVGDSYDHTLRGQVQTESVRLGMAMQHLGALFLELGRTILTLRMGPSPAESVVYAGPAVYISPSGPNPIMVQPFPLQTSSLFGHASGSSPNPVGIGSVGVSSIPRSVNIHIHTGASLAPVVSTGGMRAPAGEGIQGERVNVTVPSDSVQPRDLSGINISSTGIPSQPSPTSVSGAVPPGTGVPPPPGSRSASPIVAEINAHLRNLVANMQNGNNAYSGQAEVASNQEQHVGCDARDDLSGHGTRTNQTNVVLPHGTMLDDQRAQSSGSESSKNVEEGSCDKSSASNRDISIHDGPSSVPLGLGLGGLQPKKRGRQPSSQPKDSDGSQIEQSRAVGQQVLQSLASRSSRGNSSPLHTGQPEDVTRGYGRNAPTASPNIVGQGDVADAMSQVLQSPSLDGLLAGVSQQTGVGSPDMLRNMLQQFTQNPALRNTVNQIAQHVDSHDLGSMFSGLDRGAGGIDLSTMMQQMMPIVSQALGGIQSGPQQTASDPMMSGGGSRRGMTSIYNQAQGDQQVQRQMNRSSYDQVFRSLVDRAVNVTVDRSTRESLVNELCNQGDLAQVFMEMLRHDMSQRFQDDMEP